MNKRKLFLSLALFLMAGSTLSAQNKSAGINLSIWKGVSTQPADSAQTTYFNLGIRCRLQCIRKCYQPQHERHTGIGTCQYGGQKHARPATLCNQQH